MIYAYSDAAVFRNYAICTSFIITDTTYLDCITRIYNNVKGSIHGEILGIEQSLRYIIEHNITMDTDVIVRTDSKEAIMRIQGLTNAKSYQNHVEQIRQYCNVLNVTFELVQGHQVEHNPNKVVDLLARSVNDLIKPCNV